MNKNEFTFNGDSAKIFQEHFVQWVDLENYDNGVKLVTWTKQNADSWNAATTKICAQDWEAHHPGWIVVAGVMVTFSKFRKNNLGTNQ